MPKLTQRDRNGLIRRYKAGEGIPSLASRYNVSRQTVHRLIREFKKTGVTPQPKKVGRKKKYLSDAEKLIIIECYNECDLGANGLEIYIDKTRHIHIPHNQIHTYLLAMGIATENHKKKRQRKYCRYQREHSMSLWHTDWKEIQINGEKKYVTVFIDDCSRLITCCGLFDSMTTENTLLILEKGIKEFGCPEEIVTDNGTQYCATRNKSPYSHKFGRYLIEHGIKHIRSRVHHPQTNGKVERFFREVEARYSKMGSIEKIMIWQNSIKPHRSLDGKTPEEMFWSALSQEQIFSYINSWFWETCNQ